jgi:hypothetical protein
MTKIAKVRQDGKRGKSNKLTEFPLGDIFKLMLV